MKKNVIIIGSIVFLVVVVVAAYALRKSSTAGGRPGAIAKAGKTASAQLPGGQAGTSQEAILTSQGISDIQKKTDYLLSRAGTLYSSGKYKDAADVCRYIMANYDNKSPRVTELWARANTQLEAAAQRARESLPSDLKEAPEPEQAGKGQPSA